MSLAIALRAEFARRRGQYPRYSLRAFALRLGVRHATMLRLMRGDHAPSPRITQRVADALGLSDAERQAMALEQDGQVLLREMSSQTFRTDCRWIAMHAGMSLDRVQVALQYLLRCRRIALLDSHSCRVVT